jgi:hypothetical protein
VKIKLTHALALAMALAPAAALAQQAGACAPFTVKSGSAERSVEIVDVGEAGPTPGDMRIGRRSLTDEAGNPKGSYRWIIIGLDGAEGAQGAGESYGVHVMNLPDGQIQLQFFAAVVGAPNDPARPSVGESEGVIVGGTGAYAFARGTVRRSFDGTDATYVVDVRCD